jgi:hypothetical protein
MSLSVVIKIGQPRNDIGNSYQLLSDGAMLIDSMQFLAIEH